MILITLGIGNFVERQNQNRQACIAAFIETRPEEAIDEMTIAVQV
jgi:hypothetical protein